MKDPCEEMIEGELKGMHFRDCEDMDCKCNSLLRTSLQKAYTAGEESMLNKCYKLVEKLDPQTGHNTSVAYWGYVLKSNLKSMEVSLSPSSETATGAEKKINR